MKLTERTCVGCKSKFDLKEDKYFNDGHNKFIIFVKIIKGLIVDDKLSIDSRLICESCYRDRTIKKILK